jgi:hypothetical protein
MIVETKTGGTEMELKFTFGRKSTAEKQAEFYKKSGYSTRVTKSTYVTRNGKRRVGYHVFRASHPGNVE